LKSIILGGQLFACQVSILPVLEICPGSLHMSLFYSKLVWKESGQKLRKTARYFASCATIFALVFATAASLARSRVHAEQRSTLIIGKDVSGLFERVRGQTADLSWRVEFEPSEIAPDLNDARQAAARTRAAVVIWFEVAGKNALYVNALETATGQVFQRKVGPTAQRGALSASASSEAAALVVRSLLLALAETTVSSSGQEKPSTSPPSSPRQGGDASATPPPTYTSEQSSTAVSGSSAISPGSSPKSAARPPSAQTPSVRSERGPERKTEPSSPRVEPEPEPEPETKPEQPAVSEGDSGKSERRTAFELAAGWHLSIDGASEYGQQGPIARLGLAVDGLYLGVFGLLTVTGEIREPREPGLTIRSRRYGVLGSIGYAFVTYRAIKIVADLSGGALLFTRSTEVLVSSNLEKNSDSALSSFILQGDTRLQWFPDITRQRLGLEFCLSLAVLPAAPVFQVRVRETDEIVRRAAFWVIQPAAWVAFVVHV